MKFKKPKFWDLEKKNLISYLLLPFTIPIKINNYFLDKKSKDNLRKIKTICVGNIYIGGTGKTPSVLKLYEILNKLKFKVSIGKKYYSSHSDENILIEKKSKLISEKNRENIIDIGIKKNLDYLIFDDGLQDKKISYGLEIVCFDNENWVGNGNLIPSGPLREKLSSLAKYDAVFLRVTEKNDGITKNIIHSIKDIKSNIKIFKTSFKITNLNQFDLSKNYLAFSGIGNPNNFKKTLINNNFNVINEIIFPDHHKYSNNDIEKIKRYARKINAEVITTEKDYVKISVENRDKIKFLEVDLRIENEDDLINFLKTYTQ